MSNKYLDKHGLKTFYDCIQKTYPMAAKTKAQWDSDPTLMSKEGYVYIYLDAYHDDEGNALAAIKVGDGQAYIIDLPYIDEELYEHIHDSAIHVNEGEREFWNNKVRCFVSQDNDEHIIFTTN